MEDATFVFYIHMKRRILNPVTGTLPVITSDPTVGYSGDEDLPARHLLARLTLHKKYLGLKSFIAGSQVQYILDEIRLAVVGSLFMSCVRRVPTK